MKPTWVDLTSPAPISLMTFNKTNLIRAMRYKIIDQYINFLRILIGYWQRLKYDMHRASFYLQDFKMGCKFGCFETVWEKKKTPNGTRHGRCAGTILCRQCTSETESAPSGVIIILSAWFQQLMHRQKHNTEKQGWWDTCLLSEKIKIIPSIHTHTTKYVDPFVQCAYYCK